MTGSTWKDSLHGIVLERVANGEPASEILSIVCLQFEEAVPGSIAGVTILDRTAQVFQHAVFPSLSNEYGEALQGIEVVDKPGTCALAVFEGRTVECTDIQADDRFSPEWRALSLKHGMKAVLSIPTMHSEGLALGTFVVAYDPQTPLDDRQRRLAAEAATLCGAILTYRRNQLRHELLVGELQHRVRNLFSTIGAVVYSTLKSHPEPDAFRKTFDGRLLALSRAHSIAIEADETELRQLLADTLAPYSVDHDVTLQGPQVRLTQEAAVAFSLAAHELATNAAKYGAFSKTGGSVRVSWNFEDEDELFSLEWIEAGGPPVKPPHHLGYGQKTIHRSLASAIDGTVKLDYRPNGLMFRVSAPQSPRLGARAQ